MSKTLGNSPDPLGLINKHGADGVRVGMLLTAPAGNDLPFDEALCEQGRNFSNKIWNALRLVKGWNADATLETPEHNKLAISWFEDKLNETLAGIEKNFTDYRISEALMATYKLIWDDFCSWYLEMVKPAYQQPIDAYTLEKTIALFEALMKMLHPFMPFITEEIWHLLRDRKEGDDIIVASMPVSQPFDAQNLKAFDRATQIIMAVRNLRKEKNIPFKEALELKVREGEGAACRYYPVVLKMGNLTTVETVSGKPEGMMVFTVGAQEFYIPVSESLDVEAEIKKIEEELNYTRGFLKSVQKKLSNERFVNNAPAAVVEKEKQKQADAEARIKVLEEQLHGLK